MERELLWYVIFHPKFHVSKNLGLEFLPYMPSTDQIGKFLKVLYLRNELRYEIARHKPKFFKIINQKCFQKTDMINFPFDIGPRKQWVRMKLLFSVHLSLLQSVSLTFFCRSNWLVSSWFYMKLQAKLHYSLKNLAPSGFYF